jgi:hypothetical protein
VLPSAGYAPAVRKIAPIDLLDDLPELPASRSIKLCDVENCREAARPGGWRCCAHHRLEVRRWRSRNHTTINARRRNVAADRDGDKRAADSARAKVAMALKRGTIARGHCTVCGSLKTTAYIADPAKWREIVWVCRCENPKRMGLRAPPLSTKCPKEVGIIARSPWT